jgi:hypothetical protein
MTPRLGEPSFGDGVKFMLMLIGFLTVLRLLGLL